MVLMKHFSYAIQPVNNAFLNKQSWVSLEWKPETESGNGRIVIYVYPRVKPHIAVTS